MHHFIKQPYQIVTSKHSWLLYHEKQRERETMTLVFWIFFSGCEIMNSTPSETAGQMFHFARYVDINVACNNSTIDKQQQTINLPFYGNSLFRLVSQPECLSLSKIENVRIRCRFFPLKKRCSMQL